MYRRALNLRALVEHRSVFQFDPRQTGKSTLVRHTFPDAAVYDLLEADTFHQLSTHPGVSAATNCASKHKVIEICAACAHNSMRWRFVGSTICVGWRCS
ncbi:MAG: hypothetical protein F4Y14_08295 [Acidobacteria bacterium]|nr:hypothetical protein [Acidobacteriota bacterium]